MNPVLLIKDVGGLSLYYPGQALLARVPRSVLGHAARVGGDAVRKVAKVERRIALDELNKLIIIS